MPLGLFPASRRPSGFRPLAVPLQVKGPPIAASRQKEPTMTSATANTSKKNLPTCEAYLVEERILDAHAASLRGVREGTVEKNWVKVGVGFSTAKDNTIICIGKKDSPAARRYLMTFSTSHHDDSDRRIPVANLFELKDGEKLDFKKPDGVAFLCSDDSLNVIIGAREDPEQLRYNLRKVQRRTRSAAGQQRQAVAA